MAMKKKNRSLVIIILIVIGVIIFFWPKECGSWSTGLTHTNQYCDCIGIITRWPQTFGGAGNFYCWGICNKAACKCMEETYNTQTHPVTKTVKEVPC